MVVEIFEVVHKKVVQAIIVLAQKADVPLKKDGWNFNWNQSIKRQHTKTYVLKLVEFPATVEGVLQLKLERGMLIMDLIEIAPHNIGKNKKYEKVAECLIAFGCRESFKIEEPYKGFLTFTSKTNLIKWYQEKYGAELALGQNMFICPEKGLELMNEYLTTNKI